MVRARPDIELFGVPMAGAPYEWEAVDGNGTPVENSCSVLRHRHSDSTYSYGRATCDYLANVVAIVDTDRHDAVANCLKSLRLSMSSGILGWARRHALAKVFEALSATVRAKHGKFSLSPLSVQP